MCAREERSHVVGEELSYVKDGHSRQVKFDLIYVHISIEGRKEGGMDDSGCRCRLLRDWNMSISSLVGYFL